MNGKGKCARRVLIIGVETGPYREVAGEGGLRRIVGHEHEVTGLRDREMAGAIGQSGDVKHTVVGDGDGARFSRAVIRGGEGLGDVVERLREGVCPISEGT